MIIVINLFIMGHLAYIIHQNHKKREAFYNRNGRYRAFEARGVWRLTVRISIEKGEGTR